MLTSDLVRVRFVRDRVEPQWIDANDPAWREIADRLLELFRNRTDLTRGQLSEEIKDSVGAGPGQIVAQGLAKLLEDRCEFEVASSHPPEQLRRAVFTLAARQRSAELSPEALATTFHRDAVLESAAAPLQSTAAEVDKGLFADLKSEQRLVRFKDVSSAHLLARYNVALAQAVLLKSTGVRIEIRGASPPRLRQLCRQIKFHRLVCEIEKKDGAVIALNLDGPLSLFTATQKYGLQLALFLPAILRCDDFLLRAELRWGHQRKEKLFTLSHENGLTVTDPDRGTYVPAELSMFVQLFRKRVQDWEIHEETDIFPLGKSGQLGFWVPDYRLVHAATGREVFLDVMGFWRKSQVERQLQRLKKAAPFPFLLAISEQFQVDDANLDGLPAVVHRFRQMPLPDEIVRLASQLVASSSAPQP